MKDKEIEHKVITFIVWVIVLTIVWIAGVLSSCTVEQKITHKLRKSQRLRAEAIALGAEVRSDTVYKETTVFHKGETTTVTLHHVKDSTIFQDRIKIQFKTVHDSVRINVQCPNDTIRIRVPYAVTNEIICPPKNTTWRTICLILIGLLTLLVLFVAKR